MEVIISNLSLVYRNEIILRVIDFLLNQLLPVLTDNTIEK